MSAEILLGCVGVIFIGVEIFVGIIFMGMERIFFFVGSDICLSHC